MTRRRRRAGDEGARQVEQQRRVLVGAGVEALQRGQEIAAAKIRIADQVEGRIARDEVVPGERCASRWRAQAWMMRSSSAIGTGFRPAGAGWRAGWRCGNWSSRAATGRPMASQSGDAWSRAATMASRSASNCAGSRNCGRPARDSSGRSSRIGDRGLVELAQMRVAAARAAQQRIAKVVDRRAVLWRGQRAIRHGPGTANEVSGCTGWSGLGEFSPHSKIALISQ